MDSLFFIIHLVLYCSISRVFFSEILDCEYRRAKPKKRYTKEWNAPVEEWEKEVCIFQQRVLFDGFNRKKLSVQADSSKFYCCFDFVGDLSIHSDCVL